MCGSSDERAGILGRRIRWPGGSVSLFRHCVPAEDVRGAGFAFKIKLAEAIGLKSRFAGMQPEGGVLESVSPSGYRVNVASVDETR